MKHSMFAVLIVFFSSLVQGQPKFNNKSWIKVSSQDLSGTNAVDDPSPLLRVQLIFKDNSLVGIVHSRPLKLPNTTAYKLNRGFQAAFFNDTPKEAKDNFIKQFNQFINSVD